MDECIDEPKALWFPGALVGLDHTVDYHQLIENSVEHTFSLTILLSQNAYCGEVKTYRSPQDSPWKHWSWGEKATQDQCCPLCTSTETFCCIV